MEVLNYAYALSSKSPKYLFKGVKQIIKGKDGYYRYRSLRAFTMDDWEHFLETDEASEIFDKVMKDYGFDTSPLTDSEKQKLK